MTSPELHLFLISDMKPQHNTGSLIVQSGREADTYLPDPGGNITVGELVNLLDSVCSVMFCFMIYR